VYLQSPVWLLRYPCGALTATLAHPLFTSLDARDPLGLAVWQRVGSSVYIKTCLNQTQSLVKKLADERKIWFFTGDGGGSQTGLGSSFSIGINGFSSWHLVALILVFLV